MLGTLLVVLSGCQKKQASESNRQTNNASELVVWTTHWPKALENLTREFASRPEAQGKRLKVIQIKNAHTLDDWLIQAMSRGQSPDLVLTTSDTIGASPELFAPALTSEGFTPELFRQVFVRSASDSLIRENLIYGVPVGIDTLGILYNRNHLESRLQTRNVPASTWNAFREDMASLSIRDPKDTQTLKRSGAALGDFATTSHPRELIENIHWQMGGALFDPTNRQAIFDRFSLSINQKYTNLASQSWGFWRRFAQPQYRSWSWDPALATKQEPTDHPDWQAFLEQKTSLIFAKASDQQAFKKALTKARGLDKKNVAAAFLPKANWENKTNSDRPVLATVWSLAVPRQSQNQGVAWAFLKFVVGQAPLTAWYESTGLPTPRVDLLKAQEEQAYWPIFVRQAKFAQARNYPVSPDFWQAVLEEMWKTKALNMSASYMQTFAKKLNVWMKQADSLGLKSAA